MRAVHWAIVAASARLGTCPGRGAAFFMPLRRAGTVPDAGVRYGPGSAAHRFARAARCAASGARRNLWSDVCAAKLAAMTDVAASDFRHPRRYVRLDTILRLRWLAVLGQLAAIFVVVQGLNFDLPIIPCVTIVSLSALLNLVLQIAFNPMQRL